VNLSAREVERTLRIWTEVDSFFKSNNSDPFVVNRSPTEWYSISIDASAMVEYLRAKLNFETQLEEGSHPMSSGPSDLDAWRVDPTATLRPALRVSAHQQGATASDATPDRGLGRLLQQLFLAINIAEPGTCDFSVCKTIGDESLKLLELDSEVLNIAFNYAREFTWPTIESLPFEATWRWLHDDLQYDCDVAKTSSQKALFGLLRVCVRRRSVPYDLLIFAEAFEGLLVKPKSEPILATGRRRLNLLLGEFPEAPDWFDKLYDARSRLAHGSAPIIRPDEMAFENPEVKALLEQMFGPEWEATAALLALLQDLVRRDAHAYDLNALDPPPQTPAPGLAPYVAPLLDDMIWNAIQEFDDAIEEAWGDPEYGKEIMGIARQVAKQIMSAADQLAVDTTLGGWDRLPAKLKDIGLHDETVDAMQIAMAETYSVKTRAMAERCLALTRLVISARPKERVLRFLRRASRCYILGLPAESIILCRSALETAVTEAFDRSGIEGPGTLNDRLIAGSKKGMFTPQIYRDALVIKQRANVAVHNDPEVPTDALGTLQLTMGVLSSLYAK
jgi:hypothetical protein